MDLSIINQMGKYIIDKDVTSKVKNAIINEDNREFTHNGKLIVIENIYTDYHGRTNVRVSVLTKD